MQLIKKLRKIKLPVTAVCLMALAVVLYPITAPATFWYSFISVSGTNSAPMLNAGFGVVSNGAYVTIPSSTIIVTNINTNEAITLNYGAQMTSQSGTNLVLLGTMTTNFPASAGWTNGSTWIWTAPGFSGYAFVTPYAQMCISNGQFSTGTWTNGVAY